jgi:hypothetical protein
LSEIVTGTLETDFDMSNRTVKLASGDEKQVEFAPVPWTGNKTLWKVSTLLEYDLSECDVDHCAYISVLS